MTAARQQLVDEREEHLRKADELRREIERIDAERAQPAGGLDKLLLTEKEACAVLSISPATLWRLRQRGLISPVPNLGRSVRYSAVAVKKFAEKSAA